jgi:hypothetical protein
MSEEAEAKRDAALNFFTTTKNVFKKLKQISPSEFFELRDLVLDAKSAYEYETGFSKEEMLAISTFIKHMHEKYGQKDIYLSAWTLHEDDWNTNEIHKGMDAEDKKYLTDDLNLYMTSTPSKIDQWICNLDKNSETSYFFCTLKSMSKVEKETWLEVMKAIERYFN